MATFCNIQLYKVHLRCSMNYLSQVGELANLSLVIKPTVQNKSFHSNFWLHRFLHATIYNCSPACVTHIACIRVSLKMLDQIVT